MKKIHLAGFFLAGLLILCAIFVVPKYNAITAANKAIAEGSQNLEKGEIAAGLSEYQHAMGVLTSQKSFNEKIKSGLKNKVVAAAAAYPLKSNGILGFVKDNGITISCDERISIYNSMLEQAKISAKNNNKDEIRECLNLAATWAGQCPVGESLTKYRIVYDYYKKVSGSDFIKSDWMGPAYEGKPIAAEGDETPRTPAGSAVEKAQQKFTGIWNKVQQKAGLAKPSAEQKTEPATPGPVKEQPAAGKPMPEATAPAQEEQPEGKTAPDKKPVPEAAAKPAASPAATPVPPIAPPKKAPGMQPAPVAAQEPPAKKSVIDKIKSIPGTVMAKVNGLLKRDKKEAPAAKEKVIAKNAVAPEKIEALNKAVSTSLKAAGINAATGMSADGTTYTVSYTSENIGKSGIKDELKSILKSVDEGVAKTGGIPLKVISIEIKDDGNVPRANIGIGYSEYQQYKEGKLSGEDFRKSWSTR